MFTLKSEIQFDMAHYLSGYVGKCKNIRKRVIITRIEKRRPHL